MDKLRELLNEIDTKELLSELRKDKDINRMMQLIDELFGASGCPTIEIALKPNDDGVSHSLSVRTEGTNHAIIVGLAEIVANVMAKIDEHNLLREDAYENFGKLVKENVERLKNKEEK